MFCKYIQCNVYLQNTFFCKSNHRWLWAQKVYQLRQTKLSQFVYFFSRFEGTRGDKNQIFHTLNIKSGHDRNKELHSIHKATLKSTRVTLWIDCNLNRYLDSIFIYRGLSMSWKGSKCLVQGINVAVRKKCAVGNRRIAFSQNLLTFCSNSSLHAWKSNFSFTSALDF